MADKSNYYDFLYAYTLGCLDEDELNNLKNFLDSSDDYYWQELGEYQNLSSLLPSILVLESPDPEVKDKVARKLYRIRNEIKAKRDKLKKENKLPETTTDEKTEPEPEPENEIEPINESVEDVVDEEFSENEFKPDVEDFEVVSTEEKPENNFSLKEETTEEEVEKIKKREDPVLNFDKPTQPPGDNEIDTTTEETEPISIKTKEESATDISSGEKESTTLNRFSQAEKNIKPKKKSALPLIITFLTMLILLIVIGFMYFKVSSSVNGYEEEIISLNQEIANLKTQYRQSRDLQLVLGSKNFKTITLTPTDLAKNASGKLFISLDTNHGILQLSSIPEPDENETYELWIYIYDNYMSLGKFNPVNNSAYFPFDVPQLSENSKVSFILTREPAAGTIEPGDKVYLKGSF